MDDEKALALRREMACALGGKGISNQDVLRVMAGVPRHLFVSEKLAPNAYDDRALPIGHGQTISQPYAVALMTELLRPAPDHRVLEVGTGSGYQAAVLASIVKEVYTVERVPELHRSASALLLKLGYKNIITRWGDGYGGWNTYAPYDGIVLTAAPAEVPVSLLDQLKDGGRMVLPAGETGEQRLKVIIKMEGRKFHEEDGPRVGFVRMFHGTGRWG